MKKTSTASETSIDQLKKQLGKMIRDCRDTRSMRNVAGIIGLPPSNLKYIEDGVNAPSAEVYEKLINALNPAPSVRNEMDILYMTIRNTPPPDVCSIVIDNQELNNSLRILKDCSLTPQQLKQVNELFQSFKNNT